MATVTVKYYGVEGSGRTLTEAKKDAGAKIERSLSGSYSPAMLRIKDWLAFIYREPSGWHYVTQQEGTPLNPYGPCVHGPEADRKEAEQRACWHLCQNAWDGETGEDFDLLTACLDQKRKRDLLDWSLWQVRARHARSHGLTPDECHRWASEHGHDHVEAIASVPRVDWS